MKSRINKDAREISISELWWHVISKWKWLIVGMLVGALVLGVYGAYNASKEITIIDKYTMDNLTTEEQEEVKALIEDYEFYQAESEKLEKNYLMNLNHNYAYRCTITFYIDTDYSYSSLEEKEDYVDKIISIYKTYVRGEDTFEKIMNLGIEGLEQQDINYLVGVSGEGGVLKIDVHGDRVNCEKMATCISDNLVTYYDTIAQIIGEHRCVKISTDVVSIYSDTINNVKNIRKSYISSLLNEFENNKKSLSEIQRQVLSNEISKEDILENAHENKVLVSWKKIVIGAILGVILCSALYVVEYFISKKVKSIEELKQVYNVEILGNVVSDDTKNKITVMRNSNIISKSEQKQYVSQTITNICRQNNISNVSIISTVTDINDKITDIVKLIKDAKIDCKYAGNINCDVNTLSDVVDSKNVILVEQLNATKKTGLEAEIETCDKLSTNILGMIVII